MNENEFMWYMGYLRRKGYKRMEVNKIYNGDALEVLKSFPDESIDCVITSPPYWGLRDYGVDGQLGLEPTFQEYINKLCDIFDEVKRVLKKIGTCWVVIGDTYANNGLKYTTENAEKYEGKTLSTINAHKYGNLPAIRDLKHVIFAKSLIQIPSRFALEMANRGWILRNEIIWYKTNCMPSSAKDRFTVDFEKIFFFVKNKKYWFEQQFELFEESTLIRCKADFGSKKAKEGETYISPEKQQEYANKVLKGEVIGRNKRCVWDIATQAFSGSHFAIFPEELCITPIKAGCPEGGVVLDPFMGAGTVAMTAKKLNRKYIGIELNQEYIDMANKRIEQECGSLF